MATILSLPRGRRSKWAVLPPTSNTQGGMMLDIRFEIGGRSVDPKNMRDALEAAMLSAVQEGLRKKVGSCRCPEHGQSLKLVGKGRSLDNLNFEISGCCEKAIEEVRRKLGAG